MRKKSFLRIDLQKAYALHIETVVAFHIGNVEEDGVAVGATYDGSHTMHIGWELANGMGRATACARSQSTCHLKWKDLIQNASSGIAIKCVLHNVSPVGSNGYFR
jgi:hypothetical protein